MGVSRSQIELASASLYPSPDGSASRVGRKVLVERAERNAAAEQRFHLAAGFARGAVGGHRQRKLDRKRGDEHVFAAAFRRCGAEQLGRQVGLRAEEPIVGGFAGPRRGSDPLHQIDGLYLRGAAGASGGEQAEQEQGGNGFCFHFRYLLRIRRLYSVSRRRAGRAPSAGRRAVKRSSAVCGRSPCPAKSSVGRQAAVPPSAFVRRSQQRSDAFTLLAALGYRSSDMPPFSFTSNMSRQTVRTAAWSAETV